MPHKKKQNQNNTHFPQKKNVKFYIYFTWEETNLHRHRFHGHLHPCISLFKKWYCCDSNITFLCSTNVLVWSGSYIFDRFLSFYLYNHSYGVSVVKNSRKSRTILWYRTVSLWSRNVISVTQKCYFCDPECYLCDPESKAKFSSASSCSHHLYVLWC